MSDFAHVLRIDPHPANVREELGDLTDLAASIREHGIVQPNPRRPGAFVVIAGHRRLAAAKLAGLDEVPISIRPAAGPGKAVELMLVENCQRRDLNPMEKGEAMGRLREHGYTATAISKAIGLTVSTVTYYLALLELSAESREQVRDGHLPAAEAVRAVRGVRAAKRKRGGLGPMGAVWEPDYLSGTHPLAKKAGRLCEAREHSMRRRIGKTACGQCWETVIRQDEAIACRVQDAPAFPDGRTDPALIDGPGPEWHRELAASRDGAL